MLKNWKFENFISFFNFWTGSNLESEHRDDEGNVSESGHEMVTLFSEFPTERTSTTAESTSITAVASTTAEATSS